MILEQLITNIIKETNLNYLNKLEYRQIVEEWNGIDRAYPHDKTIQRLFEEQVKRTPDNIAIVYEGDKAYV